MAALMLIGMRSTVEAFESASYLCVLLHNDGIQLPWWWSCKEVIVKIHIQRLQTIPLCFLVDKYNESIWIASCLVLSCERYYLTVQFGHLSGQGDIRTAEQRSTTAGLLASLITVSDLQEQFLQPLLLYNNTCQYFTREDCILKGTVHPKKKIYIII